MDQGWIALDIDGTTTEGLHPVPRPLAEYLANLVHSGWKILFITGRTYSFAQRALDTLQFPYYFAVQNGADILEMPSKKLFDQRYLDVPVIHQVERAYRGQPEDFLVYAGFAKGDFCYYRPHKFSPGVHSYLAKIKDLSPASWQAVESFDQLGDITFPLIKCLGEEKVMRYVEGVLLGIPELEVVSIRDPLRKGLYLALVTHCEASKGKALERVIAKTKVAGFAGRRVIAAGDDRNDLSMLALADVRIVMETAPQEVLEKADIIAPSVEKMGLLTALKQAIECS